MSRWFSALTLALALVLIGAACSGDDDAPAFVSIEPTTTIAVGLSPATGDAEAPAFDREAPDAGSDAVGDLIANQVVTNVDRDIIFRAELVVGVDDVAAAVAEATRIIESLGGFVFGQQTTGGPQARSVITFKVLPKDFRAALTALGAVGELRTQNVTADDVTDTVVDLESRIRTAAASVERLRALLEEAGDIESITEIERELLARETQLETLRGRLRTLQDQVALATIVLTLTEALADPGVGLVVTAYEGHDDGSSCPGEFEGVGVEEGEAVTLCFEVVNTGDTPLTGFEISDTVLELDLADFIVLFGDPDGTLEPGQSFELAAEVFADRDLRTRTRVEATPVNEAGDPVTARTLAATSTLFVNAIDPGGLPGFADGVSASWNVLETLWGFVVVGTGSVLPFLWLLLIGGLFLMWRRRRTMKRDESTPVDEE